MPLVRSDSERIEDLEALVKWLKEEVGSVNDAATLQIGRLQSRVTDLEEKVTDLELRANAHDFDLKVDLD